MNMTRTQLACLCLVASAFMLGAMVLSELGDKLPQNEARAEMVVSKDSLTMLTTQYQADSELVYVLDNQQDLLLAYMINRNNIELLGRLNLSRIFRREAEGGQQPNQGRRPR